jgi:tripeptidyl-peptidase I
MSKYFARSLLPFIFCLICNAISITSDEKQKNFRKTHVFKESMPTLSSNDQTRFDRVGNGSTHEVVFVIRQRNMEDLTRILHDISDPKSPNYGQHLSRDQVTSMTSNPESRDVVLSYLNSIGSKVKKVTPGGEYIIAEAPITLWENVFKAEFFTFRQILSNGVTQSAVRADQYSVPSELDAHVESVLNIVDIPVAPRSPILRDLSEVVSFMTLKKIRETYNIDTTVAGSVNSTQAIFASIDFFFSPKDLKLFQASQGLVNRPITRSLGNHVDDDYCIANPIQCTESNLDVQYIMATSPGSPTTFWYTDAATFASWLIAVASDTQLHRVLSISYGQDEKRISTATSNAFNTAAVKLSAMGVTILVSSGDDGALSNRVRSGKFQNCGYEPDFPASSPYVTAVGATSVRCNACCFTLQTFWVKRSLIYVDFLINCRDLRLAPERLWHKKASLQGGASPSGTAGPLGRTQRSRDTSRMP